MQHFYTLSEYFARNTVTLVGDEHHHATRACRVRIGENITVTDGCGKRVVARITDIDAVRLTAEIIEDVSGRGELPVTIILALAAINPARFETAVEKCTELGVRKILPVKAERCEKNAAGRLKQKRLEKIVLSAAKQSGRSWVPEITEPVTLDDIICNQVSGILLTASQTSSKKLDDVLETTGTMDAITILVGPEGDFSGAEYELLEGNTTPVYLGGLTLRSETAAITAVAVAANKYAQHSRIEHGSGGL